MHDSTTVKALACLETVCTLATVIVSDKSFLTAMSASRSINGLYRYWFRCLLRIYPGGDEWNVDG